jgi:hypothetical protein
VALPALVRGRLSASIAVANIVSNAIRRMAILRRRDFSQSYR